MHAANMSAPGYKRLLVVDKSHDSIVLINGEIGTYDSPLSVMASNIPMLGPIHAGKDWTCSDPDPEEIKSAERMGHDQSKKPSLRTEAQSPAAHIDSLMAVFSRR